MVEGGDNQLEPCLWCTWSGSWTVTCERYTAKSSRKVLTFDLVGCLGVLLKKLCCAVDLKFG